MSRDLDDSSERLRARAEAAEARADRSLWIDRQRKQGILTLFDAVRHATQPMDGKQVAVLALCLQRLSLPTVTPDTLRQNDEDLLAVGLDSMPDIPDAAGAPGRRT